MMSPCKSPFPEGNAIVYCEGAFGTTNGKTAHGLVRRSERYRILSVIDSLVAGQDAGVVLDGNETGIPIVGSLKAALQLAGKSGHQPTHFTIGLAPASDATALIGAAATWLAFVNLVLAIFNLLPGSPRDGGRIARALLWRMRRDKMQATRWATGLGQLLGYGMIGIGLLRAVSGDLGGIWFMLLGFFLSSAAGVERQSSELLESLRGVDVGSIMTRDPLRVPASLTVDTFAYAAMQEPGASTWLVTGPGGQVVGILALDQLRSVRGDARQSSRVGELATPIDISPVAYADEQVVDLIERLGGTSTRAVVRDRSPWVSDIVGLLTPEDIARSVKLGKLRGSRRGTPTTAAGQPDDGRLTP